MVLEVTFPTVPTFEPASPPHQSCAAAAQGFAEYLDEMVRCQGVLGVVVGLGVVGLGW